VAIGLATLGTALVASGQPALAVLGLLGACLLLITIGMRVAGTLASLTVIFTVFHAIYGLAGPIAAVTGAPLPAVFTQPYRVEEYLFEFGLSTIGLGAGLAITMVLGVIRTGGEAAALRWQPSQRVGIVVVALGSLFEIVNCVRAGGWPIIVQGKAVYQSAVDSLVLTLPSSQMVSLGLVTIAVAMARNAKAGSPRVRGIEAVLAALAMLPSVAITLALGYRSPLLEWLLVVVVGAYYYTPLRNLTWRMLALAAGLYVASGVVFANRAIIGLGLATGDWRSVWEAAQSRERLVLALNPAATEFGAAFGNFSEYVSRATDPPRLGATYLRALTSPIPSFLYPGTKPQQIGYEFRDRFFPSMALESAIAGTAYSSILEAYINFGSPGTGPVYLVLAMLLALCERVRQTRHEPAWHFCYVLLVSNAVSFHRSDASLLVSAIALNAVVIVAFIVTGGLLRWVREAITPGSAPGVRSSDVAG